MFNIVVSANKTAWETDQLMRLAADRFTEHSGHEAESISIGSPISLKRLEAVPTLLMYERCTEGENSDLVRYGFPKDLRQADGKLIFRFEEHGHLSRVDIDEFSDRLGMHPFEHNRTHWAIKDGDIPRGLLERVSPLHVGEKARFFVFYAWQSDRPSNGHRRFIREALDLASGRINSDRSCGFTVEIDQDTQGVSGLCDIPATILQKITSADAFVADLTYVATTDTGNGSEEAPRYCSNPNVLFELGFAFRAIGWERLICVMNEEHGPTTEQIFDLDHRRHPITYRLPNPHSTREVERDTLSQNLESAIRSILPLGVNSQTED